ncbi:GrpE protein [Lachnoclostridium phytofermentans ISDg]|uniref:Protein GrpE n=2 Tax=Lachnoclostridium phytofermentans TaxID=66219 RepID=GRPE_LACP7|nr:RecName: Full=Protein GrpE; AltName: Full=HSP-70 cofactor [Lachnoclostridium phytofermentans ISDg]ABX42673.1 GrpE protein [Lachnoclostridium phytofermentans ISDg]
MADNMDFKDLMADEAEDIIEKDIARVNQASEDIDQENQSEVVDDTTENEDASEEVYEEDTASEDGSKEKKSFFKKKEKKDKKDEKIDELTDRLMRNMAEFENFRKRTEKEKTQMFEVGAKDIIERILPVIDNFERGLAAVSVEEKDSAFVQGIEKIYKQLVTTLEAAGVKQIEAAGKEFDPDFHNAVMHAEDEEYGENIVAEEFQKGYMYRETVVRHSMVKVVN